MTGHSARRRAGIRAIANNPSVRLQADGRGVSVRCEEQACVAYRQCLAVRFVAFRDRFGALGFSSRIVFSGFVRN